MLYWNPLAVSDGLMGMAIVGGAALALGGLVGLGVAALKKKWPFRCASFPECNSVKCDGAFASWCLGDLGVLLFTFCCCWSRQLPRACLLPVSASFSTCLWLIPRVCLFLSFFSFFFPHKFVIFAELLGSFSWGVEIGFGLHAKAFLLHYFL